MPVTIEDQQFVTLGNGMRLHYASAGHFTMVWLWRRHWYEWFRGSP